MTAGPVNPRRRAAWLAQLVAVLAGGALLLAAVSLLVGWVLYVALLALA